MEIKFSKKKVEFQKELNSLDKFVLSFTDLLDKLGIKYVLISGYVAIVFGRNRSSEDIDILMEKISFEKFSELWNASKEKFACINAASAKHAYDDYLLTDHAIRFSEKSRFIPNIEIKFPKTGMEKLALEEKVELLLNKKRLFISPLELQISFKLYLGSEKDIEDARFLYMLFKDKLDMKLLEKLNKELNVKELFNKYLSSPLK